jgi:tetratricopeptide (TPR) repeat protein
MAARDEPAVEYYEDAVGSRERHDSEHAVEWGAQEKAGRWQRSRVASDPGSTINWKVFIVDVQTAVVQQLMEIGYMAAGGRMSADAATIFDAIEAVRPESELPLIGHAVTRLNAGRADEAIALLRKALERNPDSEFAAAFLGLSLKQAGLSQAAGNILQQVVSQGKDAQAVGLAKSLLES